MTVTESTSTKETPDEMTDLDMAELPLPASWERAWLSIPKSVREIMATLLLAGVLALVLVVGWELGGR